MSVLFRFLVTFEVNGLGEDQMKSCFPEISLIQGNTEVELYTSGLASHTMEVGWMCLLPEGLDAPTLITIFEDELKKTLNHYYPRARLIHLQQDNSSVHTSKIVKNWLKKNKIPVLPWPSQSPDLNPIENLWADLKKRVYRKNHNITSKKVLWNVIQEEWEATPLETCKRLIESIPERLKAVLKVKRNPTRY